MENNSQNAQLVFFAKRVILSVDRSNKGRRITAFRSDKEARIYHGEGIGYLKDRQSPGTGLCQV